MAEYSTTMHGDATPAQLKTRFSVPMMLYNPCLQRGGVIIAIDLIDTVHPGAIAPAEPGTGKRWMGVLGRLAEALVPGDTENWQIQIAVQHDAQGCFELHVHTCIKKEEPEDSPSESRGEIAGGYL